LSRDPEAPDRSRSEPPTPSGRPRKLKLALETVVPVVVRSDVGTQWALARNISDAGMLIELATTPPIGSRVEVKLFGVPGSLDAPHPAWMCGEVRHHVCWNFRGQDRRPALSGVVIRFVDERVVEVEGRGLPS
jgi:hypothetical protein